MYVLLAILLVSIIEFFGDANFKEYSQGGTVKNLTRGFLFYFAMIFFLLQAFKSSNLIYVNTMWDAISTLISALLAMIILKEIPTKNQVLGIVLIVAGMFFMGEK